MAQRKLPPEAFDFYASLGPKRSYQAVATKFGVSKRTVTNTAKAEDWRARLDAIRSGSQVEADRKTQRIFEELRLTETKRLTDLQQVFHDVLTPDRLKAIVIALFKNAIQKDDHRAVKMLLDRLLGRPRSEPLPPNTFGTPDGLEKASDVRTAANALLKAVAQGLLAPEDAQRTVAVIEAARRSIETEELEKRIVEIEERLERDNR